MQPRYVARFLSQDTKLKTLAKMMATIVVSIGICTRVILSDALDSLSVVGDVMERSYLSFSSWNRQRRSVLDRVIVDRLTLCVVYEAKYEV